MTTGSPQIGDRVGRYELTSLIGRGGMGSVYAARDSQLDRVVAIKLLRPDLLESIDDVAGRFEQETAILARLQSRHILPAFDAGRHGDRLYVVTAYFPDGDLGTLLRRDGALPRGQAARVVHQVAEAVQDAHHGGVVHRDIKPANVLVRRRPGSARDLMAFLGDFGIAQAAWGDRTGPETRTGTVVGSPAYMAPERHLGRPADERADVYSLGCLLHATLTGRAPYSGTDFEVVSAHVGAPIPALPSQDEADRLLNGILRLSMAKAPERRFRSAGALMAALEHVMTAGRE